MAFVLDTHRILYFPVPKVACTTLKRTLYELEHGRRYDLAEHGRTLQLSFPTQDFDPDMLDRHPGYWSFAVVRDPLRRIVSAYGNKIGNWSKQIALAFEDPGRRAALQADGLGAEPPSLVEFALKLPAYRRHFRPIRHHTDGFAVFLGDDLSRFDRVYRLEDLEQLRADLARRTGRTIVFPHNNRSTRGDRTLNAAATEALLAFTAPDYALLSELYARPTPAAADRLALG